MPAERVVGARWHDGGKRIAKRFMLSVEDGAKTPIYCATSPEVAGDSGLYYDTCATRSVSELARAEPLARDLWERSQKWVGFEYPGA